MVKCSINGTGKKCYFSDFQKVKKCVLQIFFRLIFTYTVVTTTKVNSFFRAVLKSTM